MGRARHDHELARTAKARLRLAIEGEHLAIERADDEEHRCDDRGQGLTGEVGPSAARDDRPDRGSRRGRDEGRGGAGARAEIADRQVPRACFVGEGVGHRDEPLTE